MAIGFAQWLHWGNQGTPGSLHVIKHVVVFESGRVVREKVLSVMFREGMQ